MLMHNGRTALCSNKTNTFGSRLVRSRSRSLQVSALLDPHRTLGVDVLADEASIKRAYRKLALQYHPDVCRTLDAERRFMELTAAYELLIGKARGKEIQEPGASNWDWHDWYWQFRAQRNAVKQQRSATLDGVPPPPGSTQHAPTTDKAQVTTQLAGLRHRAAIRANRQRTKQHEQPQQSNPSPTHDHNHLQEQEPALRAFATETDVTSTDATTTDATSCRAAASARPQPEQPAVHFDAAEAPCDGVFIESEDGVTSAEEGAAPPRPRPRPTRMYAGTTDTRSHVANQIVGLRRKAAFKCPQQSSI